ncbi:hypothetical protein [Basilea psittacipulmonis]|uniref:Uncharacterized protein n=1 Tax=Basilea psittacipulmonis DSM 24701 TaxID=1072685 RepID=A0A077DE16_9BURK|nr:hypothetical protein [Basilea psittacipulmonis]AIL33090.1 hypothetical protein IX83_07010 [Basilea psittacipulmonis DSM 24701]
MWWKNALTLFNFVKNNATVVYAIVAVVSYMGGYFNGTAHQKDKAVLESLDRYQKEVLKIHQVTSELSARLTELNQHNKESVSNYEKISIKNPLDSHCATIPAERVQSLQQAITKANATLRGSRTMPNSATVKK